MKNYILPLLVFSSFLVYPNVVKKQSTPISVFTQNPIDRKLSAEEVKQRGIDLLVNQIIENIDEVDLRKTARSAIFETSYGFRWKMVNLSTSKVFIIKVDKDFKLISVRNADNSKNITP
ncbi:hypothetical protein [Aquimarina muelleri]|uniref:Uncharacterized protein n=1 Tax=Aquimarina muelleri TaxID=279356 RepID=A0A918N3U2_9FLAO|nr:hypothetical protein [Aquimarina muelleri]MCX2763577.1 hypothetical protein [Aquimarina muelleri]GGX14527.1 hypothetical protein GCM10007384_15140 [Aquimarina muelleri]